ncbi:nose resistant to fluoxetine protein 6-like [Contarinia nasturtii]|uniref:nose resistant to fluoxetine protein 6-like n=1 Tax=Contarinia nasturtii TaxID=265458 RepID=UPI0012D4657B|nr:nose resistant to fluoxetine protein 6-like [Contarinia nasturtii]
MAKTGLNLIYILLLSFVICGKCDDFDLDDITSSIFDLLNLEGTKDSLLQSVVNLNLNEIYEEASTYSTCLKDLSHIREGLLKFEELPLKILDSWGKIPSGMLNGNKYEFGEFLQCLDINERTDKPFKVQYCLGQINFDAVEMLSKAKWIQSEVNSLQKEIANSKVSNQTYLYAFNFGICLPRSCTPTLLEHGINDVILKKITEKVSVSFSEEYCQFEETPSNLTSLDVVTICVLALFLFLIVVNTLYDVILTITKREKTQAFLAFSFYSNGLKLFSQKKTESTEDTMQFLHGIRVISTMWIVLGHTFLMYLFIPVRNSMWLFQFKSQYHNMIVVSALVATDTFFFISGLLVSYKMLKNLKKPNGRINIVQLYFHRYLRLTPVLGFSILFSMSLLRFFGSGPIWGIFLNKIYSVCARNWWSTLLYIQNYVNGDDMCVPESWYLSVDMQLFVISPAIVYFIYKFNVKAVAVLSLLILGGVVCTVLIDVDNNFKSYLVHVDKFNKEYILTHTRFTSWLSGVLTGYLLVETRKRTIRIPKLFNLFAWTVALALMATVIFANYPLVKQSSTATLLEYGLYDGLSRVFWSISLCYIVFACVHNYGGPVNWLLSRPFWQPLSRLSYSMYILNIPVLLVTMVTFKHLPYFTEFYAFHTFIGNYVITVFVSIIVTLTFESPIIEIEKLLFGTNKPILDNKNNINNEVSLSRDNETYTRCNDDTVEEIVKTDN